MYKFLFYLFSMKFFILVYDYWGWGEGKFFFIIFIEVRFWLKIIGFGVWVYILGE